jgi:hypothetical protein
VAQLYLRELGSLFLASYDSQGYGGGIVTRLHTVRTTVQVQVEVILRPTVSQTVRLGVVPLLERVIRCYISLSDNYFFYFFM